MLIITALNVTTNKTGEKVLQRKNGTADYLVEVAVNYLPPIFIGSIKNHIRDQGASALLRRIADAIDAPQKKKKK
jgi:hypothetical protein